MRRSAGWGRGALGLVLLAAASLGGVCIGAAQPTDASCVPSDVPAQTVLSLSRAAGVASPSAIRSSARQILLELQRRKITGPVSTRQALAALGAGRMSAETFTLLVADLADGSGRTPTAAQARQTLLRRGTLPSFACLTPGDLDRLLRGVRTGLEDPYRMPAARTAP